jgi:hypothetical protein
VQSRSISDLGIRTQAPMGIRPVLEGGTDQGARHRSPSSALGQGVEAHVIEGVPSLTLAGQSLLSSPSRIPPSYA